jgi:hypothetical protein
LVVAGCRFGFDPRATDDGGNVMVDGPLLPTCSGHDEEGDGFPDACDVCPTVPDPTQPDGDKDGVGDACDPRPMISGDYIQVFDPHTAMATAMYSNYAQDTSFPSDRLRLGTTTTAGQANFTLPVVPTRIEARMHVVDRSTTMIQWFGIWYSQDVSGSLKVFAQADDNPGPQLTTFTLKEDSGTTNRFATRIDYNVDYTPGDDLTMLIDAATTPGGTDTLRVLDAQRNVIATTSLVINIARSRGGFLEAEKMVIDYDYFIAYGIR